MKVFALEHIDYTPTGNPPVRHYDIGDPIDVLDEELLGRWLNDGKVQRDEVTESKREELRGAANKSSGVQAETLSAGAGASVDQTGGVQTAGVDPARTDPNANIMDPRNPENIQGPEKPGPTSQADFGTNADRGGTAGPDPASDPQAYADATKAPASGEASKAPKAATSQSVPTKK